MRTEGVTLWRIYILPMNHSGSHQDDSSCWYTPVPAWISIRYPYTVLNEEVFGGNLLFGYCLWYMWQQIMSMST